MNKESLIRLGLEICEKTDYPEACNAYETWKTEMLRYAEDTGLDIGECKLLLHVVTTPYETKEACLEKYQRCITKGITFLEKAAKKKKQVDVLENIVANFGVYLQNMFMTEPEKKCSLKIEVLEQIKIENEYDVQHMMYAVIKAAYPSARREVNVDIGYATDRYDIIIPELDTVIEIKCTRKDHSDKKLLHELGDDAFFYKCSKLIIYVYDKSSVIKDVANFVKALEKDKIQAGIEIRVYIEQNRKML